MRYDLYPQAWTQGHSKQGFQTVTSYKSGTFLCELWLQALELWDMGSSFHGGALLLAKERQANGQRIPWLEAVVLDWIESMHGSES